MSSGQSLTQVGALLLLSDVAHEWSTMLTDSTSIPVKELGHCKKTPNSDYLRNGLIREGGAVAGFKG